MDKEKIKLLEIAIHQRWARFKMDRDTDRKNLSELWNIHLKSLSITTLRPKKNEKTRIWVAKELIDAINFRNEEVSGAVCVGNPDRTNQFLFIPREVAEKILIIGMP